MNGKDLLAVLVMIVPSLLLIALIAVTLAPNSEVAPPPGNTFARNAGETERGALHRAGNAHAMGEASPGQGPQLKTQKGTGDPWKQFSDARDLKASER